MIFSGMISSNTAECKFYLKSGVIKFQFIIIIILKIVCLTKIGMFLITANTFLIKVIFISVSRILLL